MQVRFQMSFGSIEVLDETESGRKTIARMEREGIEPMRWNHRYETGHLGACRHCGEKRHP
jgi:hypothetical protein